MNEDGSLKEVQIYGKTYKGKELYDVLEAYVRRAFFAVDNEEQRKGRIFSGLSGQAHIHRCLAKIR